LRGAACPVVEKWKFYVNNGALRVRLRGAACFGSIKKLLLTAIALPAAAAIAFDCQVENYVRRRETPPVKLDALRFILRGAAIVCILVENWFGNFKNIGAIRVILRSAAFPVVENWNFFVNNGALHVILRGTACFGSSKLLLTAIALPAAAAM